MLSAKLSSAPWLAWAFPLYAPMLQTNINATNINIAERPGERVRRYLISVNRNIFAMSPLYNLVDVHPVWINPVPLSFIPTAALEPSLVSSNLYHDNIS